MPKIFTDITVPAKQSYGPNIGKICHALKSELTQVSATQLQHLNKKSRDG